MQGEVNQSNSKMQSNFLNKIALSALFILNFSFLTAQEQRKDVSVDFRVNVSSIDPNYSNNSQKINQIFSLLEEIQQDTTVHLLELQFCGAASPEGSYQVNRRLANQRLSSLEKIIRSKVNLPDSIITRNDSYIPWEYLKSEVEKSNLSNKEQVISIIEEEGNITAQPGTSAQVDSRILKLKALNNGETWKELNNRYFKHMRNAYAVFVTFKIEEQKHQVEEIAFAADTLQVELKEIQPEKDPVVEDTTIVVTTIVEQVIEQITETVNPYNLYIKTNTIGLAAGIANAAVEIDIIPHLSFNLPVYYSAWDYFKTTIKLRTLYIQPELRYWLKENNQGFFAGAHFGFGYYNIALDGDYRYQDHNRETPAIGGGLAVGYRMPISTNNRWHLEFSLGGGAYQVHYDTFHNTPDTKKGLKTGEVKKTYIGPDQAAVSITYSLPVWKKGGRR